MICSLFSSSFHQFLASSFLRRYCSTSRASNICLIITLQFRSPRPALHVKLVSASNHYGRSWFSSLATQFIPSRGRHTTHAAFSSTRSDRIDDQMHRNHSSHRYRHPRNYDAHNPNVSRPKFIGSLNNALSELQNLADSKKPQAVKMLSMTNGVLHVPLIKHHAQPTS